MKGLSRWALGVALLVAAPTPGLSQVDAGPRPAFLGFEAGAHLVDIADHVTRLGGEGLHCRRSRRDPRVADCRATLTDPTTGTSLSLWLSAIDSLGAVITVSGEVTGVQLDGWRDQLERHYGRTGARIQGNQWMMQWIGHQRMVRLTWRIRGQVKEASVSLVDGPVLDAWGRTSSAVLPDAAP